MACHARHCRPCVLSKGHDGMPRPTSFDHVCYPKAMMHATPDVVQPYVLPIGDNEMQRSTLFDRVFCPKAVMACHALRHSTVFAVQGL